MGLGDTLYDYDGLFTLQSTSPNCRNRPKCASLRESEQGMRIAYEIGIDCKREAMQTWLQDCFRGARSRKENLGELELNEVLRLCMTWKTLIIKVSTSSQSCQTTLIEQKPVEASRHMDIVFLQTVLSLSVSRFRKVILYGNPTDSIFLIAYLLNWFTLTSARTVLSFTLRFDSNNDLDYSQHDTDLSLSPTHFQFFSAPPTCRRA